MANTKQQSTNQHKAAASAERMRVERQGAAFVVFGRGSTQWRVWRDNVGAICCECGAAKPGDRCVHMSAVRDAIRSKSSERLGSYTRPQNRANVIDIGSGRDRRGIKSSEPEPAAAESAAASIARIDPAWSYSIKEIKQLGNFVVVGATVTANGVVRDGIGTGLAASADGFRDAEEMAIRQAVAKFTSQPEPIRMPHRVFPSNPVARSLFDLVTAKQLAMIRTLGRDLMVDESAICEREVDCRTDELSKSAASEFIGHLLDLKSSGAVSRELRLAS